MPGTTSPSCSDQTFAEIGRWELKKLQGRRESDDEIDRRPPYGASQ